MSDGPRLPLAQADALAQELAALLAPVCRRVVIAGSIRRRRETVGDIELLVVPRFNILPDLFGDAGSEYNELDGLVRVWLDTGVVKHRLDKNGRPANGERYKRLRYQGVALDLFVCLPPAEFGLLLAIRTGPSDYSKTLVTPRSQGGWLPNYLQVQNGAICRRDDGTVLPTPEEHLVYTALGLPYVPPEQRDRVPDAAGPRS